MNIGLIAHDSKKTLMQNFCIAYRGILSKNNLYATGTTGRLIEEVTNLNVHKYLAGPLGESSSLGHRSRRMISTRLFSCGSQMTRNPMSRMSTMLLSSVICITFLWRRIWPPQN